MAFTFNTLVLSDIHLGEDLSPTATADTRHSIDLVEQQLVSFLRHYTRQRRDGRPWRLVFNGDLIDFISICLHPEEGADARTVQLGQERTPAVARAKVEAVADHHADFFGALARFLSRGNRVEIISGNHDTEFIWPTTQSAFRDAVAAAWARLPEAQRAGAPTAADVTELIDFHPWFFHEPGVLWIEHGHQYDECCSIDHQLYPRTPNSDEIVLNVDAAGTRYITSRMEDAEAHMQEGWSMTGYLRWGLDLGLRKSLHMIRAYARFSGALLRAWRSFANPWARSRIQTAHGERLRALAERWSMDERTLMSLDNLHRRPVVGHLGKLMAVLMLDKLVAFLGAAAIAVLAFLFLALPWSVAVSAAAFGLAKGATWLTGRGRQIDCGMALQLTSGAILREVDAKIITFGHTHAPVAHQLDEGRWYFNTGTWVPNGRPGLLRSFTHLIVRHTETGPVASLCQWRDGASRGFTPGWAPAATPAAVEVPIGAIAPTAARQNAS